MKDATDDSQFGSIEKVKIPVGELEPGMYVCELDRPWLDSPFLFQGFTLNNWEDVEEVRRVCRFVYIDRRRSRPDVRLPPAGRPLRTPEGGSDRVYERIPSRVEIERELDHAVKTRQQVETVLQTFIENARSGRSLDLDSAGDSVAHCVESIYQNADAMLLLTQLKHRDEYTSEHSMNACVLSILLGRHMGMDSANLHYLGLCGLLHDIGKIKVPQHILNKPARLTVEEDRIMRLHPDYGMEILQASRGIRAEALAVAYGHHERIDGSGYPRGVRDEELSLFTKIVAIADSYDAITSDRVYKAGLSHMEALSILNRSAGIHFDRSLTLNFIECLGVFPAGSIVEMSSGEVALVLEVNPTQKLRPKVLILLDADKTQQIPRAVDLAQFALDPCGQPYRIRATLPSRSLGMDISRFFQRGAVNLSGLS
jgi:HD-GYP domain-containing protein (c-di-GMP phosphodiesterase class II)